MEERRKHKRLPIDLELEISKLFRQGYQVIDNLNEGIEVVNISKTGIGFISKAELPLDYYFNSKIQFTESEYFYCVIKIIRKEKHGDDNFYGCEFVGLAEFLAKKVDNYEDLIGE